MKKYFISIVTALICLLAVTSSGKEIDKEFQDRVWQAIESFKSRKPVAKEEFVNIDLKKVVFPHKRHQELVKELGETCRVCHHKKREDKPPRACRRCHAKRKVVSEGKYARAGQELNQKDIFHLLCGDCHNKMLYSGYRKPDGTPAMIPAKCHHCHIKKDKTPPPQH